jgi:ubiquinone/menaquinone biosynthesis C-methylase UbiE
MRIQFKKELKALAEHFQNEAYTRMELGYNAFMRPAHISALSTLALPPHSKVLDVGCGPGGLFPILDDALHSTGTVLGCDISRPNLIHAKKIIEQYKLQNRFSIMEIDLRKPLPFEDNSFDWAWSADVIWPSLFSQPQDLIGELCRVVKPGGLIAIFFFNMPRFLFLPGYESIEQYIRLAECKQRSHQSLEFSPERANRWLRSAGLQDIRSSVHAAYHQAPLNDKVKDYMNEHGIADYKTLTREQLLQVGMSPALWETWQEISNPKSESYILNQEDYYCALFGMFFSGRTPQKYK